MSGRSVHSASTFIAWLNRQGLIVSHASGLEERQPAMPDIIQSAAHLSIRSRVEIAIVDVRDEIVEHVETLFPRVERSVIARILIVYLAVYPWTRLSGRRIVSSLRTVLTLLAIIHVRLKLVTIGVVPSRCGGEGLQVSDHVWVVLDEEDMEQISGNR